MRVALVGRDLLEIEPLFPEFGLERVDTDPEVVLAHGGDGTLLGAERDFPGVPKLALRNSSTCKKCLDHENKVILRKLAEGSLSATPLLKLETSFDGKTLFALNDIVLHNEILTSAIRFQVGIDGENHSGEVVGDGFVIATPFGSSAYYRSITHSIFQVGIGLAFNNSTEQVDHLVLHEDSVFSATILRGPAQVAADNDPNWISLQDGDEFSVRKADQPARILGIDTVRCPHCIRYPDVRRPDFLDRRMPPAPRG
jgi:NAD+ kinase